MIFIVLPLSGFNWIFPSDLLCKQVSVHGFGHWPLLHNKTDSTSIPSFKTFFLYAKRLQAQAEKRNRVYSLLWMHESLSLKSTALTVFLFRKFIPRFGRQIIQLRENIAAIFRELIFTERFYLASILLPSVNFTWNLMEYPSETLGSLPRKPAQDATS